MTTTRKFPRDHHLRRLFFVEQSFTHKARTNLLWLSWLLDRVVEPGNLVLDPMGGTGSILFAAVKGYPTITGELEAHQAKIQHANTLKIRNQTLINAPAQDARWDAAKLPLTSQSVPAIVTSPPYYDMFSNWNRHSTGRNERQDHIGPTGSCYGFHPAQIGNLHVYEKYLETMRAVYRECWRVLKPGGTLVLIIGDRVKNKRRVPIVDDTAVLCQANGFTLLEQYNRRTIPSHFRNIHAGKNGDQYPRIEEESALVLRKRNHRPASTYSIIEAPKANNSPGRQLFEKQRAYAFHSTGYVLTMIEDGLHTVHKPKAIWQGDHPRKARIRKDWAFEIVRRLVEHYQLSAGDQVELHVTDRYARYLEQRLITFGAEVTIPTARMNFGQKLTWYTQALKNQA